MAREHVRHDLPLDGRRRKSCSSAKHERKKSPLPIAPVTQLIVRASEACTTIVSSRLDAAIAVVFIARRRQITDLPSVRRSRWIILGTVPRRSTPPINSRKRFYSAYESRE